MHDQAQWPLEVLSPGLQRQTFPALLCQEGTHCLSKAMASSHRLGPEDRSSVGSERACWAVCTALRAAWAPALRRAE